MNNVIALSDIKNGSGRDAVASCLQRALDCVEKNDFNEGFNPQKIVVVIIDDSEDSYNLAQYSTGIDSLEAIAAFEILKAQRLVDLQVIEGPEYD